MAFKMKGAPYPPNRKGKVNPNSEGNTDLKDGRSASAALQYSSPMKQTDIKVCASCGYPVDNHPYRHPIFSTMTRTEWKEENQPERNVFDESGEMYKRELEEFEEQFPDAVKTEEPESTELPVGPPIEEPQ